MSGTDRAQPFDRASLHSALDAVLDAADADGGVLDVGQFWNFVTGLAQGRGLTDHLHEAGLEALGRVQADGVAATSSARQGRAYHIGLLTQLLADLGASVPEGASMLPRNFALGAIMGDLAGMLAGAGGSGKGDPQILTAKAPKAKGDEASLRRYARQKLVGVTLWRMGRERLAREAAWFGLMGDDADRSRCGRWFAEVGGTDGEFGRSAFAAGQTNDRTSAYAATNADLARVIELANSGPGGGGHGAK